MLKNLSALLLIMLMFIQCEYPEPKDTIPPTVVIIFPYANAVVSANTQVRVEALDNKKVEKVWYYLDGQPQGEVSSEPYLIDLFVNNLQDGLAHNIQAAASDTEGNVGLSTEVIFTIAENEDIIDPTVTIINPQPGQTVEGNVRILAIAEDERSIQKVEFYIDGDSVGLATLSPYSYNWNTTPFADSTNHTIFAKAFDGGNNKTTSSAVTVTVYPRSVPTDITTPIVSILYPVSGLIISGIVNIIAEAIDDLEVEQVQFYVDGALISTDSDGSNGWSYNWNTTLFADGGTHIIYLKAYDVSGNTGLSAPISVTVPVINDITPPTALVLYPVNGSTVSGIVNITADVTDDVAVSKVEFYIDGKLLSTDTNGTDTWSYNWNTATYNNGQLHSIYLKAYDSSNNIGTSALVTVTVPL